MKNVRELEPTSVFGFFADICRIPRGSYNTKEISDFLVEFAKERNLRYIQDELNNVIIYKDATFGYEDSSTIILQGHMDMVCEKTDSCNKDMTEEGIDLIVEDDWLTAVDTTLGADNGIAVAYMLAVLDAADLKHPAIECVFTSDEETGLEGAEGLDGSKLKGRKMINLDSEEEGVFSVSCAGGVTADVFIPIERTAAKGRAYALTISGLLGGHSGMEINKEHGNANVLMGRILNEINKEIPLNIVTVNGGNADNVICKRCDAVFCTEEKGVLEKVAAIEKVLITEYATSDPGIRLSVEDSAADNMLSDESTEKVISYLLCAPYGIQNMSADIDGLVETSLNLGVLNIKENDMYALYSVRSSVKSRQNYTCDKLEALVKLLGGHIELKSSYPGWVYRIDSPLRDLCVSVFREQYGYEPKIEAIHAGLECGFFAGKFNDDFDAVSFGPDLANVHTPDEKMSISSANRVWTYLCNVLEASKEY